MVIGNTSLIEAKGICDGLHGLSLFIEGHCDNTLVTRNTTLIEAKSICDTAYSFIAGHCDNTVTGIMALQCAVGLAVTAAPYAAALLLLCLGSVSVQGFPGHPGLACRVACKAHRV